MSSKAGTSVADPHYKKPPPQWAVDLIDRTYCDELIRLAPNLPDEVSLRISARGCSNARLKMIPAAIREMDCEP